MQSVHRRGRHTMTSYVATLRISYKLRGHYLLQAQSDVVYLSTNVPSHLLFLNTLMP
jgi:hypothetical protein